MLKLFGQDEGHRLVLDKILFAQHHTREVMQVGKRALKCRLACLVPSIERYVKKTHPRVVKENIFRGRRLVLRRSLAPRGIELDIVPIEYSWLYLHVILTQRLILNGNPVLDYRLATFHLELIYLAAITDHHLVG